MKERQQAKHPGESLRQARLQAGLPEAVIARKLGIDLQTLEQLEGWQLDQLPPNPYLLPLTRRYCQVVDVDFSNLTQTFPEALPANRGSELTSAQTQPVRPRRQFVVASTVRVAVLASLVLVIFGYVLWQGSALGSRPQLEIASPQSGITISEDTVLVEGQTSQEAQVYINGTSVLVAPSGKFEYSAVLKKGVNELRIEAVNNIGGERVEVLTLIQE
jgi:cytoskeletal protein RodZ